MGCDIHGVVERRVRGKWVAVRVLQGLHGTRWASSPYGYVSDAARSRNYERFAALAGVRGAGPAPRGVPEDASETTAFLVEDYGADGHSHSWLPLAEAAEVFARTEYWPDDLAEDAWPRRYPASLFFDVDEDSAAEHRLIFWFDN
jgi:hypothetical protein